MEDKRSDLEPPSAQAFLAVRRAEWESMRQSTLKAEVNLLLERY